MQQMATGWTWALGCCSKVRPSVHGSHALPNELYSTFQNINYKWPYRKWRGNEGTIIDSQCNQWKMRSWSRPFSIWYPFRMVCIGWRRCLDPPNPGKDVDICFVCVCVYFCSTVSCTCPTVCKQQTFPVYGKHVNEKEYNVPSFEIWFTLWTKSRAEQLFLMFISINMHWHRRFGWVYANFLYRLWRWSRSGSKPGCWGLWSR